ncbi:dienelactone hydrolase family protein [Mesorhizobium sp. BE184]|uniref:dienelactone hydrolase family protein n=1 Tax=Mesorhizobium sp. BE184 TaxID=2817714 RepID=UPI002858735A|nr:dienelactone hydrolase family protein [Mesorhizobium sp. BE184]MDR7032854.1 carboxymethylenebutenolidase [Mesorhizobium sp. BE184]
MKQDIEIRTPDGTANAAIFGAGEGSGKAGVILYMDAFGLRPAMDEMAERLEREGYVVLVPDLFYRNWPYGPFDAGTTFSIPERKKALLAIMRATSSDQADQDGKAFLDTLASHGVTGPIGAVGYCIGGARALTAAATYPDRIKAAASFHAGNLASDKPDSPHLRAREMKAKVYVGSAAVDHSFPPDQAGRLAEALTAAEVDYIMESYVGMGHGWAVPDHAVFDAEGAERHWKRLLAFFAEALK